MMPSRRNFVSSGLVGLFVLGAAAGHAQQGTPASGSSSAAAAAGGSTVAGPSVIERFAGAWDYNPQDSINAATGRPEQNPRSATQRAPAGTGGTGGRGGGVPPPPQPGQGGPPPQRTPGDPMGPIGPDPSGGRTRDPNAFGSNPLVLAERRTLVRDLLEINEKLTIKVTSDMVSFTDDLGRVLTYPTDGKKYKYRLGAAAYEARVYWDGPQLKKDIEGAYGFRMSETYFLGEEGRRLFVIIRLGDLRKKPPPPVLGANRVYDRIEDSALGTLGSGRRRP
jgi:hypothetical protein